MRYTPTLKLSTRLAAFVTLIVTSAMFILFLGGTLSFQKMGQEYLNHYLSNIVEVVDKELGDPEAVDSMQRWIPKMLQASNIVEMQLSSEAGVVYSFTDPSSRIALDRLYHADFSLSRHHGYTIHFKAVPPYFSYSYSMGTMGSISLAVALIIFCLVQGVKWLKEQLLGSELLEERGRMILAGRVEQYAKGDEREWPYTASKAMDSLIEELQDARQERSRFDGFIRSQTFLDQLTGSANRVLFDSKLESGLLESGARGGVIMIRLDELELLREELGKRIADDLVVEVGECLSNIIARYPDVILSRYYESVFAIFMPHQNSKEVAHVASQSLKFIEKIIPPLPLDRDNWVHIGMSMYQEGERRGRIIDEVETALRSAQMQGGNAWSRFNKVARVEDERGSVRWRTLFDQILLPEKISLFRQACYLITASNDLTLVHYELFARIYDSDQGLLKASRFISAVETVGYEMVLDRAVFIRTLELIRNEQTTECYSVNLHVVPFSDKMYWRWFRNELMQLPSALRSRLSFEFAEGRLVQHLDYMRPVMKMIRGLGCQLVVGQAGRTIVTTHYIKDLRIDYLKLHRSLIKNIHQRHENQLFVRSLIGVCSGTPTQVIAVGVENEAEWQCLLSLGVNGVQGRLFDAEQPLSVPFPSSNPPHVKPGKRNRWRTK
ncbi:RNase E specificity factor CsrD [Vibrio cincinnatiensis]|jgi:RNase E specificity factor CsrD|uniref:Diguanylate cyclase/phosphodiesterase n=1 Tax=Vibrio cincinnatiensis DSM 19608 TaxID=1123491 RepID=A0A1T4QE92_VIBCI|nr:RNase E specificity factor CsrD [Vibrio cincinnatiensis]MCG3721783.1 RNase E specificity factor CsrD [Vibrio cincinnatiensis]MCG3737746.1 RNase E specificity factor CsrD [Vibrio cincinnatiensis]MCG3766925.1 RNase E specificity factor CsrD [Vibrio cincinnatiensis]SKA02133.1 diguanylate cyclase/phosphodiesterase [Vibrio cincinnatiensis DSM 19608]SUP49769.1 MSHA biogenesis protein MshH [Vibrio cincinnatiensis]